MEIICSRDSQLFLLLQCGRKFSLTFGVTAGDSVVVAGVPVNVLFVMYVFFSGLVSKPNHVHGFGFGLRLVKPNHGVVTMVLTLFSFFLFIFFPSLLK
jgi:hypothetical protein